MPSYKIHSIKNNKKLSFIIDGENSESVKQTLSNDGFIVLTIDKLTEEKNQIPRFVFEALKENKSRIEGRVDALDIFSAYEILRDDYGYAILKLYPVGVTDPAEQDTILKNILQIFPKDTKKEKEKEAPKSKTSTEVDVLKGYCSTLVPFVIKSNISNKEIILYDIKRVQMINSVSSTQEVIKKSIKALYNKGSIQDKKDIYKTIIPIAKRLGIIIFPPWIFVLISLFQSTKGTIKILFGSTQKKDQNKNKKTPLSVIKVLHKSDAPEKKILSNKNIFILLKKEYMSSWIDIFKSEGSYLYFYSLLRQNRPLFWLKKTQQYIGTLSLYTALVFIFGIIVVGGIFTPEFLFFNGFMFLILGIIFLSLVFFLKEI